METYNKSILEYQDVRDAVDYAKEEYFEKGINQKSVEIARKCLQEGMSIELVAKVTGLTVNQLINL